MEGGVVNLSSNLLQGCMYNLYDFQVNTEIKCSVQYGMCSDKKRLCSLGYVENVTFPPPRPNLSAAT